MSELLPCSKCGALLRPDEMRQDRRGPRRDCRRCGAAYRKGLRSRNPDAERESYLLREYGISCAEYELLLARQRGGCAICGTTVCVTKRRLSVDHCHATGRIRGILCQPCNTGLAKFNDDKVRLLRAVEYLQERP